MVAKQLLRRVNGPLVTIGNLEPDKRKMTLRPRQDFWREAFAVHGSIAPSIVSRVAVFGLAATAIVVVARYLENQFQTHMHLDVTHLELAGAALGVLLVFRTNLGYERWWEARKLWGGFVDRTRNLTIGAMAYGPRDALWREQMTKWTACFPHVVRHSLRRERPGKAVVRLLGQDATDQIAAAQHMPAFVALKLGHLLRDARERLGLDPFSFQQIDRERALLVDYVGGCERILNTPAPQAYSLKIRHFLMLLLLFLPLTLLHRFTNNWPIPLITMIAAYPLLSLDQLGVELQNPFATENLSHLPLDGLSDSIENNVLGIWEREKDEE